MRVEQVKVNKLPIDPKKESKKATLEEELGKKLEKSKKLPELEGRTQKVSVGKVQNKEGRQEQKDLSTSKNKVKVDNTELADQH